LLAALARKKRPACEIHGIVISFARKLKYTESLQTSRDSSELLRANSATKEWYLTGHLHLLPIIFTAWEAKGSCQPKQKTQSQEAP
jgi:hypothetical protein